MARRKKILLKSKDRRAVGDVADFLRELADRLAQNELVLRQGSHEVQVSIPDRVVLGLKVKEKPSKRGTKRRLTLSLGWTEGEERKESVTLG
jgi:amphi-Trp domain-containing protein